MDETEDDWQARMDEWLLTTMNRVRAEAGRPLLTELPEKRRPISEPQEPDEEEAYERRHGRRTVQ